LEPAGVTGSILAAEMREQPAVVAALLRSQRRVLSEVARLVRERHVEWVLIAARGSSDNAARYAQHVFARMCGLPVALASPSLSTLYGAPLRFEHALAIGISQSGESPDVRAVLERAREQNRPTVAITNSPGSPLALTADATIDIGAGAERSVAATKTYTASLAALAGIAVELAEDATGREQLAGIAEAMERQLDHGIGDAARVLEDADRPRTSCTGRWPCSVRRARWWSSPSKAPHFRARWTRSPRRVAGTPAACCSQTAAILRAASEMPWCRSCTFPSG
jgi:fructoselysine-6-P-deglycase FrlB-like protein